MRPIECLLIRWNGWLEIPAWRQPEPYRNLDGAEAVIPWWGGPPCRASGRCCLVRQGANWGGFSVKENIIVCRWGVELGMSVRKLGNYRDEWDDLMENALMSSVRIFLTKFKQWICFKITWSVKDNLKGSFLKRLPVWTMAGLFMTLTLRKTLLGSILKYNMFVFILCPFDW